VIVHAVTVQGRADAKEKFETVTEIIAVVAVERIGAVVDGELGTETNVEPGPILKSFPVNRASARLSRK
jgi:hypothetical protein